MNASVLVVLFAVAYSVSANCGCLKCSKDLTVAGKSIPVAGCGPAQIIYRGVPKCCPGQELSFTIQSPAPAPVVEQGVVTEVAKDLSYKVVPSPTVTEVIEPYGPLGCVEEFKYPGPLGYKLNGPLNTCVDKVVLQSPSGLECGRTEIITSPRHPGSEIVAGGCICNNVDTNCATNPAVAIANTIVAPTLVKNFVPRGYKTPCFPRPCGPALDVCNFYEPKKGYYRYKNAFISIVSPEFAFTLNDENINKKNEHISNCTVIKLNETASDCNGRKKREIPFLKHGYKFLMNMLPEFVQEPIKNTVNDFALTHPDKKLRKIYNLPKQLTLKEKILLKNRKNMDLLKKKLLGHHLKTNTIKKKPSVDDYLIENEADTFLSNLNKPIERPKYPWINKIQSRFLNVEENSNSRHVPRLNLNNHSDTSEEFEGKTQFTKFEKALFLKKLKKLNEAERSRSKRSTILQNYMKRFKKDSNAVLDSAEFALPFYQIKVKEDSAEEEYYYDNENNDALSKQEVLRSIVRKELQKYKYKQANDGNIPIPLSFQNIIPHTPLFHLINLPLRFMKDFNELSKQALPVIKTVPKMKRYFRDFGRNLKKNVLHLASDVIGDFDGLAANDNILATIVGPSRRKRSIYQSDEDRHIKDKVETGSENATTNVDDVEENEIQLEQEKLQQYEPDYSLVFEYDTNENAPDALDAKLRRKRYILKMVDEDEVEDFLVEKLGQYITQTEDEHPRKGRFKGQYFESGCPTCQMLKRQMASDSSEEISHSQKKVVLEPLKPKIIIDNNGLPFLEIGGYKKPMLRSVRKSKRKRYNPKDSLESIENPYYYSGEVDSESIGYLIDHAKEHVGSSYSERFAEMPVQTVKEKISQLLLETDFLVHLDFDKYDEIYDNLIQLQHIKTSVEQDWKRLIISKRIDDMNSKISLLGKFQEMQHFKDMTLRGVAHALYEENENKFITRKFLKILVRLQKLQCIINQVVDNVQAKLHVGSKFDTRNEIKYVDFFTDLNFVKAKTRNEMISNLMKDRDFALQQNIELINELKRLLAIDGDEEVLHEEASLLWEMRNIDKLQRSAIEEMNQLLNEGYKIKKPLKILFDLLKRYEICEAEQRKLLSEFGESNSEESSEEYSEEYSEENVNVMRNRKELSKKKFDVEEFRSRLQERLKKRQMLLRKKLKKTRKSKIESCESDEDD